LLQQQNTKDIKVLQSQMDAFINHNDYFTVVGFANLVGQKISLNDAIKIGKIASKISREREVPIGSVTDPRFGKINTYHKTILAEAFTIYFNGNSNL